MRAANLQYLRCPRCQKSLELRDVEACQGDRIESGQLLCAPCQQKYPIVRGIPRFVPNENYASSFGLQWSIHAKTQYDSYSGLKISQERFFNETRWPRRLAGETILEVGSGSGRFTEQAASTGAFVVSMDYSFAVEANYQANSLKENVLIVQADMFQMPFPRDFFDKLFCLGVLQHTPDPKKAFLTLPPLLRTGGELVVDVYRKSFLATRLSAKYWLRPFTRKMAPERLYDLSRKWVDLLWPWCALLRKIPKLGPAINSRLLAVVDHSGLGLTGDLLKEWAYLDTFDMLAPRYDLPQRIEAVRQWFQEAGLHGIEVNNGYNGIEGRGKR